MIQNLHYAECVEKRHKTLESQQASKRASGINELHTCSQSWSLLCERARV